MDIRLSEVVGVLSHALDVTEGQPMGHAERSMGRDAGRKLDAGAFAALEAWLPARGASLADAA